MIEIRETHLLDSYSCIALKVVLAATVGDNIPPEIAKFIPEYPENFPGAVASMVFDVAEALVRERAKRITKFAKEAI